MPPDDKNLSHHGVDTSPHKSFPNETLRLLCERASCRSLSGKRIPPETLALVLEAGIHAPTGGNLQPYSIIKIEDPLTKKKLATLNEDQMFIELAPVNLLFCIDWHRLKRWAAIEAAPFTATKSFRHFWISFQDTIIAAQNICTAADAVGLGSVYVGTVTDCLREIRAMLKLPNGVLPVVLLSLGYPKTRPAPKRKLGVDVIVHSEVYHDSPDDQLRAAFDLKYPGLQREITPERLDTITEVCTRTNGPEFARQCVERIRAAGYINPVQYYFGLHYRADQLPIGNDEFLRLMKEFGFDWFESAVFPIR
jgi:nitroreductase